jgi:hypothetical protein
MIFRTRQNRERIKMGPTAHILFRGTRLVDITRHDVPIPALPDSLEGVTLAHLSDIHFGRWIKDASLQRVVDAVNLLKPDLVMLTGDYIGYSTDPVRACARVLGSLKAPIWATLGNHDHWAGAAHVVEAFENVGINVLRNEWRAISLGDSSLYVVGLDDMHTQNHDAARAFDGLPDGPTVLLSHIPEGAALPEAKRAHFALSGHTHGGQIRVPGLTSMMLKRYRMRYVHGLYEIDGGPRLYVNRGLGSTTMPLRFGAPPEVGFFTLRRA